MTKKEFDDKLKSVGITRQDFSDMTGLSYGAINNWNDETKPIPSWVEPFLKNYIKAKDMDKVVEAVKPYVK